LLALLFLLFLLFLLSLLSDVLPGLALGLRVGWPSLRTRASDQTSGLTPLTPSSIGHSV
jgi:hypothetical protein